MKQDDNSPKLSKKAKKNNFNRRKIDENYKIIL